VIENKRYACPECESYGEIQIDTDKGEMTCGSCGNTYTEEEAVNLKQKLIDKFYRERHSDGATFYAQRGNQNYAAVDWDEERDILYPVVPEIEKAKKRDFGFEEIDREKVPDRIEMALEDQFTSSEDLEKTLRNLSADTRGGSE
jgi:transcription elongation factor Elf1